MKTIDVRYFASIREAVGKERERVDTQAATLGALRDELIGRGGAYAAALARGKAVRMALDQALCGEDASLAGDSVEVAFFPPVTGG